MLIVSHVQAKKVREITISEAVSGNSGLDGEGDQGMCQADSSTMDLNKLIESVAKGMEGSEVRKGARVKGGKKKKKSDEKKVRRKLKSKKKRKMMRWLTDTEVHNGYIRLCTLY